MNEDKYIKVKVEGLAAGDAWVHKPEKGNGGFVQDKTKATDFTEEEAFVMRKNIIVQLPNEIKVSFDLEKS